MFKIELDTQPEKFLKKCDFILQKRIIKKLRELGVNPILHDSKSLKGKSRVFRVRIGNYRILYEVDYNVNEIIIIKIEKRSQVYG